MLQTVLRSCLLLLTVTACGDFDGDGDASASAAVPDVAFGGEVLVASGPATLPPPSCVPSPFQEQGDFYLPEMPRRRDITEAKAGVPLQLRLKFIAIETCLPSSQLEIEIWQADALGSFSGGPQPDDAPALDASEETYLRGSQLTDATGLVVFETIFPGWRAESAPKIHVRVSRANVVLGFSTVYFPESVTGSVSHQSPYSESPLPVVANADDLAFAASQDNVRLLAETKPRDDGWVAQLELVL